MQNMSYERQLAWKQALVERLLRRYHPVAPIVGMEKPAHYRNKVQAAFGFDRRRGRILSGVYQSSSHRIVPIDSCLLEDKTADEIIVTVRKLMESFKLKPYDEDSRTGLIRHVLVKRGFSSGQIMVVLVASTPIFPARNNFVRALLKERPDITTIIVNINPYKTSLVLGDSERVLYGSGYIEDMLCGCVFRISARSFYQINPVQTEKLYTIAMDLAKLTGTETVVDAYCGVGTIALVAARRAGRVLGVELNREAVKDAVINAKRNRAENVRFYMADAGKFMTDMAAAGERADVVFMDPPRAGSDAAFLSALVTLSPQRVVYISCNPETQARDLAHLTARGYRVESICPVDMFPHTHHVETIVLLSKLHSDKHIEVVLNMDELDLTAAESKAT